MHRRLLLTCVLGSTAVLAHAQSPSSAFDRGSSLQARQDPGLPAVLAECSMPPPGAIGGAPPRTNASPRRGDAPRAAPPAAAETTAALLSLTTVSSEIPGVIAAGEAWRVVWAWEGNNADGPIAGDDGELLFANNDASNVMALDPDTGLARIIHRDTNTGGALSRSRSGALFVASRGLGTGILQLEPKREVFANTYRGDPLDCVGGSLNDLAADARGGVYFTVTGTGLFHANAAGVVSRQDEGLTATNGIVLSPDERTLYVTNGAAVIAFDVDDDGSLSAQREIARLRSGRNGDGSAVDSEGRLYVTTGASVDVFTASGEFLGTIPGPQGLHGVAFGGPDKRTLFGVVFSGGWGTPSARNHVIAIPMLARGYDGRAK